MTSRTDTATADPSLEFASAHRFGWGEAFFGFFITLVAVAILAVGFLFGLGQAFASRAMPGVAVSGVSIAGLDRAAAEARLREQLPSVSSGHLTLTLDGEQSTISYANVRRDYDMERMLDEAFGIGRSGSVATQAVERLGALAHGAAVSPRVRYDDSTVRVLVSSAIAGVGRAPADATAQYDAQSATWRVTPSSDGKRVSDDAAQAAVAEALQSSIATDTSVTLASERVEPTVTTAEANAARDLAVRMTGTPLAITADDNKFQVAPATLVGWVTFGAGADGTYAPTLDQTRVASTLTPFAAKIDRPAKSASFTFKNGRAATVIPGKNGLKLDVNASAAKVTAAFAGSVAGGAPPSTIELSMAVSEPALTTAAAKTLQPRLRLLGPGWTTHFPVGIKNFWGRNITIPAAKINGTVLQPGELFDFWKRIEPVSYATGYGRGGAIINGRTEKTGALAGGICSASTTMFNAAMRAGLEMGARRNHYYYISRYPVGLDATVFKGDSTYQTMTFRNDTANPLVVRGLSGFGWVRFEVYGVPDGRRVSLSPAITWGHHSSSDSVVYTRRLPPGARERVEVPVDGFSASRTRTVYDKSGKVIHRDTWVSNYATITGVVEVGAARAPATRPSTGSGGAGDAPGTGGGG